MNLLQFIEFIITFIISIIFAFYIPGRVILGDRKNITKPIIIISSLIIGMVLWGWQGYVFGYLNIRWISYLYLAIFLILFFIKDYHKIKLKNLFSPFEKIDWVILIIMTVGIFGQVMPYFNTGFTDSRGIIIPQINPPDQLWHTTLINEMVKRFPPYEPGMYGVLVKNYHYWFNLVTAELIRVFHLPLFATQYIGIYLFGSLMLGSTAYVLSTAILKSRTFVRWLLFFLYFGGDVSYLLAFILQHRFNFQVPSVIEYSTIFMDNPPRAFSAIVAFITAYLLFIYLKDKNRKDIIVISLLVASLAGFKVYTGIAFLLGLSCLTAFHVYQKKWGTLFILLLSIFLTLIVFLPANANSGGVFFNPFDRPKDFLLYKPFNLGHLDQEWRIYLEHKNFLRLIEYGVIMSAIYFIVQFGTKLLGLVPFKETLKILQKEKAIFIYSAMILTTLFGLFFNQKAHASDSFNFFVSGSFFLTILASLNLTLLLRNKTKYITLLIILLVVGLNLPRWIYETNNSYKIVNTPKFYGITNDEIKSYNYLSNNTPKESLILVLNKGYFDGTTAIVNLFSNRNMFLSGQGVIDAHNANNLERINAIEEIYRTKNPEVIKEILNKYKINYVYLYNSSKFNSSVRNLELKTAFKNNFATILKTSN